jgi:hypothetical protein
MPPILFSLGFKDRPAILSVPGAYELRSAQYPILIEDQNALPQNDVTEPESDSGASADITPSADL